MVLFKEREVKLKRLLTQELLKLFDFPRDVGIWQIPDVDDLKMVKGGILRWHEATEVMFYFIFFSIDLSNRR